MCFSTYRTWRFSPKVLVTEVHCEWSYPWPAEAFAPSFPAKETSVLLLSFASSTSREKLSEILFLKGHIQLTVVSSFWDWNPASKLTTCLTLVMFVIYSASVLHYKSEDLLSSSWGWSLNEIMDAPNGAGKSLFHKGLSGLLFQLVLLVRMWRNLSAPALFSQGIKHVFFSFINYSFRFSEVCIFISLFF